MLKVHTSYAPVVTALCIALAWFSGNVSAAPDGEQNPAGSQVAAPAVAPGAAASKDVPAKDLFGAVRTPAPLAARAIGFYSHGCLAGGQRLPIDGTEWQAMRLSRNRNWGHPALVSFLERYAADARRLDGWPGLLVGDMSQPRGGPMASGHASHQVGLDVDIWYSPMPNQRLTRQQREDLAPVNLVLPSKVDVDPKLWSPDYVRLLKRAASFGEVERVFVHPAIKKALCEASVHDADRSWLTKMRPLWGHNDHFHVRIRCPEGVVGCQAQPAPAAEDGCGKELTDWFALLTAPPKPSLFPEPAPKPLTLDKLPPECGTVLTATTDTKTKGVAPAQ